MSAPPGTRTHILSQNVCHKNLGDPEPDHIHRSRSPLSSKRLSSNNTSAVSDSAESVFRERRGLERPPRPVEVVAETPNVTVTNNGGNDDSLNSSTASQVQYTSVRPKGFTAERFGRNFGEITAETVSALLPVFGHSAERVFSAENDNFLFRPIFGIFQLLFSVSVFRQKISFGTNSFEQI